tara:strand:+ start:122 stop:508 length:387 start_codon:yes stop_codon:yes gene_type:complete
MKFENKLKHILSQVDNSIDTSSFLSSLHKERKRRNLQRNKIINTFSAFALLLVVGLFSIKSLSNEPTFVANNDDLFALQQMDEETEALMFDLADYLVSTSDDFWETMTFFEEIQFEPMYSLNINGGFE